MVNNDLYKRIVEISYHNKLSHLGSNLSSVDILDKIFSLMNKDDIFILSSGHAALALYVVLEKYKNVSAEYLYKTHGCHPHLDEKNHVYCSTGSLGTGLPVAVGRAVSNQNINVYCLISDGECAEGSIWESLQFIYNKNIRNIKVFVNINGYSAYDSVNKPYLEKRLKCFLPEINLEYSSVEKFNFLNGLNAHYHIMDDADYEKALKDLS